MNSNLNDLDFQIAYLKRSHVVTLINSRILKNSQELSITLISRNIFQEIYESLIPLILRITVNLFALQSLHLLIGLYPLTNAYRGPFLTHNL